MNEREVPLLLDFRGGAEHHGAGERDCHSSRTLSLGLPRWLSGKSSACNAGDVSLIPR